MAGNGRGGGMCRKSPCVFGHKLRTPLKDWASKTPAVQPLDPSSDPAPAEEARVAVNICTVVLGSGAGRFLELTGQAA